MVNFGTRLRDERVRLRLTQTELGLIGGVEKNTQSNYEHGKRSPDAQYLMRIAEAGADIHYIITGVQIFQDEATRVFYEKFKLLKPEQRELVYKLIEHF